MADAVLKGAVDKGDAAVCGQLLNYVIRAVGMELRVKEILDLEERLSELEAALERKGGQRYGAPLR